MELYSKEVEELSNWTELNLVSDITKHDCYLFLQHFKDCENVQCEAQINYNDCHIHHDNIFGCKGCGNSKVIN